MKFLFHLGTKGEYTSMTNETFREAGRTLDKIRNIEQFRSLVRSNPYIKEKSESYDYMFLEWADNENGDLKNTIINWCDKEIERLETKFESL